MKYNNYDDMKQYVFFLILFGLAGCLSAQAVLPHPREVDKDYRKDYRKDLRDLRKNQAALDGDEWDIVLPPEELVPVQLYNELPPASADNWGARILLPEALRARIKSECTYPVILKVADTGVSVDHPDLKGTFRLPGSNYTTSDTEDDRQGHGTHVAGIAVARQFGLARDLADAGLLRLKSVKVLSDKGQGSFGWVANAIRTERAQDVAFIDQGGYVVYNGSLGGGTAVVESVDVELEKSTAEGVIFVFAAGNSGREVMYPALSKYTMATASLDENLRVSAYSSRGKEITWAMPGRNITSTYPGGRYATLSGTSMASPFGAAEVCLALSKWGPKLRSYLEVRDYLEELAEDLGEPGHDDLYGAGITYVSKILDTDPDDVFDRDPPDGDDPDGDDPDDGPGEPTDPPKGDEYTVTSEFSGPFLMRWQTKDQYDAGNRSWRILQIPYLRVQHTARGGQETAAALRDAIDEYFYQHGHAMIIPTDQGAADVTRYVPLFLFYFTRAKGYPVRTEVISGHDEYGHQYYIRYQDEQRGGVPHEFEALLSGVRVIDIDDAR